jgi:hypothetical protein
MSGQVESGIEEHDLGEVTLVARGIATAVAPEDGLTDVQAELLGSIATALTGHVVDYRCLDPLGPDDLAEVLASHDLDYRQRIVHHMVLGELVLRPIPVVVAHRVAKYAEALGIKDDFVRVARRYAQGAYGLAWMDLERSGFVEHVQNADGEAKAPAPPEPSERPPADPALEAQWQAYAELPPDTLGFGVWDMYDSRAFDLPGSPNGPPPRLAQHDFVHVIADYGTNLRGELEVFALIGRTDPDPKGFAWLATLVGLFETGYITTSGFFDRDVRDPVIRAPGMHVRLADGIRRGKVIAQHRNTSLFDEDYHALAQRPVAEVRDILGFPPKSRAALDAGSAELCSMAGMSEMQRQTVTKRRGGVG